MKLNIVYKNEVIFPLCNFMNIAQYDFISFIKCTINYQYVNLTI